MAQKIEVQWEVMRPDEEWDATDETDWLPKPPVRPIKPPYKAGSLLLATGLACLLVLWFWTNNPETVREVNAKSLPTTTAEQGREPVVRVRADLKLPLEYSEENFLHEEFSLWQIAMPVEHFWKGVYTSVEG